MLLCNFVEYLVGRHLEKNFFTSVWSCEASSVAGLLLVESPWNIDGAEEPWPAGSPLQYLIPFISGCSWKINRFVGSKGLVCWACAKILTDSARDLTDSASDSIFLFCSRVVLSPVELSLSEVKRWSLFFIDFLLVAFFFDSCERFFSLFFASLDEVWLLLPGVFRIFSAEVFVNGVKSSTVAELSAATDKGGTISSLGFLAGGSTRIPGSAFFLFIL